MAKLIDRVKKLSKQGKSPEEIAQILSKELGKDVPVWLVNTLLKL